MVKSLFPGAQSISAKFNKHLVSLYYVPDPFLDLKMSTRSKLVQKNGEYKSEATYKVLRKGKGTKTVSHDIQAKDLKEEQELNQ